MTKLSTFYNKTYIDENFYLKSDLYTKSETNTLLNTKQATINGGASSIVSTNLTTDKALISDANGKVSSSSITKTELSYLSGLDSNLMTKLSTFYTKSYIDTLLLNYYLKSETNTLLNLKQNVITGACSTVVALDLYADRVLVSSVDGKIATSDITTFQLSYLTGLDSNLMTTFSNYYNKSYIDANLYLKTALYNKSEVDLLIDAAHDDITDLYSVITPYKPGTNLSTYLNIPTSSNPITILSSDKIEMIASFRDNNIIFYKEINFPPSCTFVGDNRTI